MALLTPWTARRACALQKAFRMSNGLFARKLGIGLRTVASWHQKPDLQPQSGIQQKLDKVLESATQDVKERFAELVGSADMPPSANEPAPMPVAARSADHGGPSAEIEERLNADPHIGAALEWLDEHTNQPPGTNRRAIMERLARLDTHDLRARQNRRARVEQQRITNALNTYYADRPAGSGTYQARCDGAAPIATSVLTRADWLDLDCALGAEGDALTAEPARPGESTLLDETAADRALDRLAAILISGSRFANMPLYRLSSVGVQYGRVAGDLGLLPFVHYALTMDLLEGELVDAIGGRRRTHPGSLPFVMPLARRGNVLTCPAGCAQAGRSPCARRPTGPAQSSGGLSVAGSRTLQSCRQRCA